MVKTKTPKSQQRGRVSTRRSSWQGLLRLGLVSFPVEAFNAFPAERGELHFHQLHAECHSRIRYQKVCPIHGEVDKSEVVSGYEYEKGHYVEIDPAELDALRAGGERTLAIEAFIAPEALDPIYYDGRMYALAPQGELAAEAYAVIVQAMTRQACDGIGQMLWSRHDQLVRVRVRDEALMVGMLHYADELAPQSEIVSASHAAKPSAQNVRLAEELVESLSHKSLDFAAFRDGYRQRVKELVAAKLEGKEIVAPPAEEEPGVINLMDALRQSLASTHGHNGRKGRSRKAPARKRRAS